MMQRRTGTTFYESFSAFGDKNDSIQTQLVEGCSRNSCTIRKYKIRNAATMDQTANTAFRNAAYEAKWEERSPLEMETTQLKNPPTTRMAHSRSVLALVILE